MEQLLEIKELILNTIEHPISEGEKEENLVGALGILDQLIGKLDGLKRSEEELFNQAEEIENISLGFTHPRFEEYYPEWNAVYNFAINVKEYINKESAE